MIKPVFMDDANLSREKSEIMRTGVASADHDALTFFPSDTMGAMLERSLFHAPEEARLDHLLDEKARILTQELEEQN